ncbi:MAG: PcfJ domain-containing protein [Eubacteriales bacterium]|nr:PcfJ domain-containing protein [Eubacteriales bacterium]
MQIIFKQSSAKAGENQKAVKLCKKIKYPRDFADYIARSVLQPLLIYRNGERRGFVTCCNEYIKLDGPLRTNAKEDCPVCGKRVLTVPYTRKRQYDDNGVVIAYREKEKLYLAALSIERDCSPGEIFSNGEVFAGVWPTNIFEITPTARAVYTNRWYNGWRCDKEKVRSLDSGSFNYAVYLHKQSIRRALQGSFLGRVNYEKVLRYNSTTFVRYLFLAAKYPQVEYLEKLGLESLIDDRLYGRRTYSAVNWRGRDLKSTLGLSPGEVRRLKSFTDPAAAIATLRKCKKEGWNPNPNDLANVLRVLDIVEDRGFLKHMTVKQLYRYIKKQESEYRAGDTYPLRRDYKDYIKELVELGYDLTDEYYLFPKSLTEAHGRTSAELRLKIEREQVAVARKETMQYKKKVLPHLIPLALEADGFKIFPVASKADLLAEGRTQHHCVAGYWDRVRSGSTAIFLIRRVTAPELNFYTLELNPKNKTVQQCRGIRNCGMTEEVEAFVGKWLSEVVKKQLKKAV